MDTGARAELATQLTFDEGMKPKPYHCTAGKLTIGVGRNLDDVGVSGPEARFMLENDIRRVEKDLGWSLPWWSSLPPSCQQGLANMCFNLGVSGLLKFKRMIQALQSGDYEAAATEALDSLWARQVGERAERIAQQFRDGGTT